MGDARGVESPVSSVPRSQGVGSGASLQALAARGLSTAGEPRAEAGGMAAAAAGARTRGTFLPLLLVTLAVFGWALFQMVELAGAHRRLTEVLHEQQPKVAQEKSLSRALGVLAGDTQRLADAGDPGARLIVAQLQKRGITIHPTSGQAKPQR